ncbi:hypothetical protein ACO0QE_003653 [Hanseniaspora vineae]
MSAVEVSYLFDILLKYRVLSSTLEKKLLHAFHPQAEVYLSVVSDLKSLCETLADPSKRLNSQSAELQLAAGNAFAPHLCKKIDDFKEILAKMGEENFFIEEKLDGERMQVHYLDYGSDIKFYSRNSLDNSFLYGNSTQTGIISQYLKLHKNVRNCILDGEMVTVDVLTGDILPFGIVKSAARKEIVAERASSASRGNAMDAEEGDNAWSSQEGESLESINKEYRPLFVVFDVVLVNDVSFEKYPLYKRKDYLENILTPFPGRVKINKYYEASTEQDIKDALDHAIRVDAEGIIIKNRVSLYKISARNDTWIKVKPEYLQYFGEEMDLLVMGKIPQKKPAYICGFRVPIRNNKSESDEDNISNDSFDESETYKYISFCKIANGISHYEDELIAAKTKNKWLDYKHEKPTMLEFGTEKPVQWIKPEESFVLEIKGRSINYSEQSVKKFKAASTLTGGYCRSCAYWIKKRFDILNISWVLDCIKSKRLLHLEPQYCFSVSRSLYKKSLKMIDKYGDSRQTQTNKEMLSDILQSYDAKDPILWDKEKYKSEMQDLSPLPLLLFSGLKFYVATTGTPAALVLYLQNLIKMFGGELTAEMGKSHIILIAFSRDNKCYSADSIAKAQNCVSDLLHRTESIREGKIPVVLKAEWLVKCVDAMFLQDLNGFRVTDHDK